jgi:chemotaxis protein CheD
MIMVGVGDLAAAAGPDEQIRTLALGSCIAVALYDPQTRCAGMVHVALPASAIQPDRARTLPGYFADTGIPELLKRMRDAGASASPGRYVVKLAGGANVCDARRTFDIGERNREGVEAALKKYSMNVRAADLGGTFSRSVLMDCDTGRVKLSSPARDDWEI